MANAAEHSGGNGHVGVIGDRDRPGALHLLLWALAGALAVRQAVAVLRVPPARWLDGFHLPGSAPGSLYESGSGRFTGTPFAGLVLKPLAGLAAPSLEVAWTCVTLLFVAAIGLVAARGLPDPVPPACRVAAAPVLVALMMVSLPVREAASPGQTAVLPVLLVLLAVFRVPGERPAGFLVGLAAALQPGLLLFAPLLWLTGRRPTAKAAVVTFAGATALSWASLPRDSWTYWVEHLAGTGLGRAPTASPTSPCTARCSAWG